MKEKKEIENGKRRREKWLRGENMKREKNSQVRKDGFRKTWHLEK